MLCSKTEHVTIEIGANYMNWRGRRGRDRM